MTCLEDFNVCLTSPNYSAVADWLKVCSIKYNNSPITVSFNVPENFDLYTKYPLKVLGNNLNINIIPSIKFISAEGIEALIIKPGQRAIGLLRRIEYDKAETMCIILHELVKKFNISINPRELISNICGSNDRDLCLVTRKDLQEKLLEDEYCATKGEAESIINYVWIDFKKPSLIDIFNDLSINKSIQEEIYMTQFEHIRGCFQDTALGCFSGVVVKSKDQISDELSDISGKYSWDIRLGSGEMVG